MVRGIFLLDTALALPQSLRREPRLPYLITPKDCAGFAFGSHPKSLREYRAVTSIQRQMRRKKHLATPETKQFVEVFDDGSYRTLHPTKDWQHFSALRSEYFSSYRALGFARI
jgi:hypothetical protein